MLLSDLDVKLVDVKKSEQVKLEYPGMILVYAGLSAQQSDST